MQIRWNQSCQGDFQTAPVVANAWHSKANDDCERREKQTESRTIGITDLNAINPRHRLRTHRLIRNNVKSWHYEHNPYATKTTTETETKTATRSRVKRRALTELLALCVEEGDQHQRCFDRGFGGLRNLVKFAHIYKIQAICYYSSKIE
jgi:hypothetical protein